MSENSATVSRRYRFIDALRGLAIVLMVVNHTARYWLPGDSYRLIYFTMIFSGSLFLFLVGFSLAISYRQNTEHRRLGDWEIMKKYFWRAAGLLLGGYLLYLAVYGPAEMFRGRILQSIAWSILLLLPWLKFVRTRGGGIIGFIFSLGWLFSLALVFDPLRSLVNTQPALAYLFFSDYAPLYYFALPLLGLILGNWFLEAQSQPQKIRRYFRWLSLVSALCAFIGISAVLPYSEPFLGKLIFWRDFNLNGYWLPRPETLFLILGGIGLSLIAAYYIFEIKKFRWKALEILGRASLMIYCLHLLLVYNLIHLFWGVTISQPLVYWLLNILLIIILYLCARIWPEIKSAARLWRRGNKSIK